MKRLILSLLLVILGASFASGQEDFQAIKRHAEADAIKDHKARLPLIKGVFGTTAAVGMILTTSDFNPKRGYQPPIESFGLVSGSILALKGIDNLSKTPRKNLEIRINELQNDGKFDDAYIQYYTSYYTSKKIKVKVFNGIKYITIPVTFVITLTILWT